jgi:hypothetical protein
MYIKKLYLNFSWSHANLCEVNIVCFTWVLFVMWHLEVPNMQLCHVMVCTAGMCHGVLTWLVLLHASATCSLWLWVRVLWALLRKQDQNNWQFRIPKCSTEVINSKKFSVISLTGLSFATYVLKYTRTVLSTRTSYLHDM